MNDGLQPVEDPVTSEDPAQPGHSRRRFLGGLGGVGAVAALAGTILIDDPASAAWDNQEGPNFIRVIDVTYFKGAVTVDSDGNLDWTNAINTALGIARKLNDASGTPDAPGKHNLPVYFPAGVYGIHEPLWVAGLRLIGETPGFSIGGGTVIQALKPFGPKTDVFADGQTFASSDQAKAAAKKSSLPEAYDSGVPMLYIGGDLANYVGKKKDSSGNEYDAVNALYGSTQRFHMSGITLQAGLLPTTTAPAEWYADYCLALLGGNTPRIDDVRCFGGRLDGILVDGGNPILTTIEVDYVSRHAIHAMNANGMVLSNFAINYGYDKSGKGSALRLEGARTTPTVPKKKPGDNDWTGGSGGSATISRGQTGDHSVHDSSVVAAPAIFASTLGGSRITNVYIETGNCPSAIKLEGCEGVRLEDCRMSTDRKEWDACTIHLATGLKLDDKGQPVRLDTDGHRVAEGGTLLTTVASYNVIRGNYGVTSLTDDGQPEWVKTPFNKNMIRIRVDPGCRHNHISDNMRGHGAGEEMIVWYPKADGPVKPVATIDPVTKKTTSTTVDQEYVPTVRNHTVGQHKVINYADRPPGNSEATSGSWRIGDIIFNASPNPGQPLGWVACVHPQGGVEFLNFGQIGTG